MRIGGHVGPLPKRTTPNVLLAKLVGGLTKDALREIF